MMSASASRKILIVADISPDKIGSWECQMASVSRLLISKKADVSLLFTGAVSVANRRHFEEAGLSVYADIGDPADAGARRRWWEVIRRERPDVVWLHFFPILSPLISDIRRAAPGSRICLTEHISRGVPKRGPLKTLLCRLRAWRFVGNIDCYLPVSHYVARLLEQVDYVPPQRIHTVYNGIDLRRFSPRTSEGDYLASVCYMRPEKGVLVLLQALTLLKRQGCEPECRLAGVGPDLETYRGYAHDNGLNVQFLGLRNDIPDLFRDAKFTIVPSVWPEAFSLAAAESLAVGVPVVASDIAGLPEVVQHNVTGLLVPPNNPEALAEAIHSLVTDRGRRSRLAQACRKRAEEMFDLDERALEAVALLLP